MPKNVVKIYFSARNGRLRGSCWTDTHVFHSFPKKDANMTSQGHTQTVRHTTPAFQTLKYICQHLAVVRTNQHSCAAPNSHCEIVLQYMCADTLRDGATETTIPDNLMQCDNYDCNLDTRYGMHEPYEYYLKCKLRARNERLFVADQVNRTESILSVSPAAVQCG